MIDNADRLIQQAGFKPRWIVELGSGFDSIRGAIPRKDDVPFSEFPDLLTPTTPGHSGVVSFLSGSKGGAFIFFGRSHLYEGVSPQSIASIVRIAKLLDVEGILFCSACGSVDYNLKAGDVLLFNDVIRFPLRLFSGLPVDTHTKFSYNFPEVSCWFDGGFRSLIAETADRAGVHLRDGVIALVSGPNYETQSEVAALRKLGASAVTMSCEPALWWACRLGVKTAMLGGVTNSAGGINSSQRLRHKDVLKVAESLLVPKFQKLIFSMTGA
ncbi:MAG: purine-nucleoside phosphorylase [Calditrichaeota bacterium]|nr:purine-nucleoside phosphorylase [Calditrichota bacterium]